MADHERLARNEAFFRDVNERINEVADEHGVDGHAYEFICECSDPACADRVTLTRAEYEVIRAAPRRFVLATGHDIAAIEIVVDAGEGHTVVEKAGEAGRVAEALDPRAA